MIPKDLRSALPHKYSFNIACAPGGRSTLDDHGSQAHISSGGLKALRHVVEEALQNLLFIYADDAIVGAGHTDVRLVCGGFGQHTLIRSWDVSMRADDGGHAAIEVPAQGDFLRSSFGVHIHEDDLGFDLFEQRVGSAKGVVIASHEHAPLQVDDGKIMPRTGNTLKDP